MSLTRVAVQRPIGTLMLAVSVLVVGYVSVRMLAVDLLPAVQMPRISVVTQYPGVGPEEIETLITRPVEQAVSTIEGIERIDSTTAEGVSRVQLTFAWGTNLDAAVSDVRTFIDRLGGRLPDEAERPTIYKFDVSAMPVAQVGLGGTGDPRRLRKLAEETIGRRLERVAGVAAADVRGGRVREIRVELDAARLVALRVSAQEVSQALARDNRNLTAGDMLDTGREVLVRTVGEWTSPAEIEGVLVARRDGRAVYVGDVARVRDTHVELNAEQWVEGQRGITMRISKQSGANTIEVVEGLKRELEQINRDYAGRLQLTMLWDSSDFIKSSVTNVQAGALFGAGLAVLVLLFFLRNLRATLVVAVAIPLSVLATFGLMHFAGYTLNIVSFGGLALGIGMLVDNAIVILENIYRKREAGLDRVEAAVQGAREVAPAVLAGTLTTVAVFAPVMFVGGFARVFFGEMAAVVTFALACSLLVAVTVVPTLSARLLKRPGASRTGAAARLGALAEGLFGLLEAGYSRLVGAALRAPWFVLAGSVLLLVASFRLLPLIGYELMPETDEGRLDMNVTLPAGTPVERTAETMLELERRVRGAVQAGELASILNSAGPMNWWRPGGGHEGEMQINLVPVAARDRGIDDILRDVRRATGGIPGAEVRIRKGTSNFLMRLMRGGSGERLVVEIRGHDRAEASRLAQEVVATMKGVEGIADARVDREESLQERAVRVNAARAADLGLSRADVAEAVETYVLGRVATRLRDGGDEYDVRVQLREADRQTVDQLAELPILTPAGATVPLGSVAAIEPREGPTSIARQGQERILEVQGGLGDRPLGAVAADLRAALDRIDTPEGFTLAIGGESAEQDKTFGGLLTGVLLAVFLVYMVMAVQFESLLHPLVIMAAVPFAFIGVVLALVLSGTTFNMNSFLGAIVLVGIVVNNAIVLVDYVNLLRRDQQMPLVQALVRAGRNRLRPILMTTATTVLAMMPLALGTAEGSEIQAPLARVIVGGLTSSTLVTLLVVPCLYYVVERRRSRAPREVPVAETVPAN